MQVCLCLSIPSRQLVVLGFRESGSLLSRWSTLQAIQRLGQPYQQGPEGTARDRQRRLHHLWHHPPRRSCRRAPRHDEEGREGYQVASSRSRRAFQCYDVSALSRLLRWPRALSSQSSTASRPTTKFTANNHSKEVQLRNVNKSTLMHSALYSLILSKHS